MNKSRQRKLIERSIIFAITFIGVLFFLIFDFGFVYVYKLDGYKDLEWFGFWTHLSNLAAFTWVSLALIAVTTNNGKIEHWIQHWNIKNTIFTFIITTGAVFIVVAYFPVVIHYFKGGNIGELVDFVCQVAVDGELQEINDLGIIESGATNAMIVNEVMSMINDDGQKIFHFANGGEIDIDPTIAYRSCVIIGTSFKHVIIPSMFTYLAFTEIGYYRTKNINDLNRTMIQFIWPSLYFVYVVTLSSCGLISPPYIVLDFGFTSSFYADTALLGQCIFVMMCFSLVLLVGAIFIMISMVQNYWNKSMCEKLNIEEFDDN